MQQKLTNIFFRTGLLAGGLLFLHGCASTHISIDSTPEKATVTVKPLGAGAVKNLGETPISLKSEEVEQDYKGSGPLLIEVTKQGYKSKSILVTDIASSNLTLKLNLDLSSGLEDPANLNAHVESLFEAQRLLRVRRFDEALKVINSLKKSLPILSSPYEMEGGIFYMNGRPQDALDAYRMAVKLNPRSVEAIRMRDLLENSLGGAGQRSTLPPSSRTNP